ncbi:MAG: hypothetical protein ACTSRU_11550 [Candidatus Hodarchaeales archaeon]
MGRYNRDHALADYFKDYGVPVDKALLLLKEGYEPRDIVRILKKLDNIERKESEKAGVNYSQIVRNQLYKRDKQAKEKYRRFHKKGYLLALSREYGEMKIGVFFIVSAEVFVKVMNDESENSKAIYVSATGLGTVEVKSRESSMVFPVTELLVEAKNFHFWLRKYSTTFHDQDNTYPFIFGTYGLLLRDEMAGAVSKIKNKIFFHYNQDLTIIDSGKSVQMPSFRTRLDKYVNGRKALDILIRTNHFTTRRVDSRLIIFG